MSIGEIIALVVVLGIIAAAYLLIRDAQKKGVPMCGKSCGGCPHPCNNDGTPRDDT